MSHCLLKDRLIIELKNNGMSNADGKLTKTEKEQLAALGFRRNVTKKMDVRPFLIGQLEKLHEHFLTEVEEESLSGSEKQWVDFAEMVVTEAESPRVKYLQFEELLDKTLKLSQLAYGEIDFSAISSTKTVKAAKTKAERLENFKEYRAINFKNLQDYDPRIFKTLDEIVVFEYLLFLDGWHYKKSKATEFYHSKEQFRKAIKIKATALETALKKLEKWKLFTRVTKGVPNRTHFTLNHKKIDKVMSVTIGVIKKSKN